MFHNYGGLINRHRREFQIAHKKPQYRDPDTSRLINDEWDSPVNVQGALWMITAKDLKRYENFELTLSDIKIITTTELLNGFIPTVKDRVIHNGIPYYVKNIVDQTYYGNFYILLLSKIQHDV